MAVESRQDVFLPTLTDDYPEWLSVHEEFIVLPDGIRLHTRVWRNKYNTRPLPAVLEYLPYRKDDWTYARDSVNHVDFARRELIGVRVDFRGCGQSDGYLDGEYLSQEQTDAVHVIEWIANQSWCDGNVFLFGKSWGGANGLQIAWRGSPYLKGVIAAYFMDDRYIVDMQCMGGCMITPKLTWSSFMFSLQCLPPLPHTFNSRKEWIGTWLDRLSHVQSMLPIWTAHQFRDQFFKQGSACEDWSRFQIPALVVGGHNDGYLPSVFRTLANSENARGLVGPWEHQFPNKARIGPAIDYIDYVKRFVTDVVKSNSMKKKPLTDWPRLQAFVQSEVCTQEQHENKAILKGDWVAYDEWPESANIVWTRIGLNCSGVDSFVQVANSLLHGRNFGEHFPIDNSIEIPEEQSFDDSHSTCFDTMIFEEDLVVIGTPIINFRVASDQEVGTIVFRLCVVNPSTGESRLLSFKPINLNLLNGSERKDYMLLEPGQFYESQAVLPDIAQRIPKGFLLRVAVSSHYWPWVWPTNDAVITLDSGSLNLNVPSIPLDNVDDNLLDLVPYELEHEKLGVEYYDDDEQSRTFELKGNQRVDVIVKDEGSDRNFEFGWQSSYKETTVYKVNIKDVWSSFAESTIEAGLYDEKSDTKFEILTVLKWEYLKGTSRRKKLAVGEKIVAKLNGDVVWETSNVRDFDVRTLFAVDAIAKL